jgi:hypothetical protein
MLNGSRLLSLYTLVGLLTITTDNTLAEQALSMADTAPDVVTVEPQDETKTDLVTIEEEPNEEDSAVPATEPVTEGTDSSANEMAPEQHLVQEDFASQAPISREIPLPAGALAYSDHSLTKFKAPGVATLDTSQTPNSARSDEKKLQKSLLVFTFPRLVLNSSNAGDLPQAEQQLPHLISQEIALRHVTLTPIQLGEALAPSDLSSEVQLTQQVQRLAGYHRSQLIVSGEILDMSMTDPDSIYDPASYSRFVDGFFDVIHIKNRFDKRERLFSFQVHLRDGFTGQQLFTKRYDTYGVWPHAKSVGFGTPLFWQSDYARQIKGLIDVASKDLIDVIQNQPFIAQVDLRPGQTQITLQGGSNNGLRAGETLSLYQLVFHASETRYQENDVRLVNRNANIVLQEVYPSHSVGVIDSSTYFSGKMLAVAP